MNVQKIALQKTCGLTELLGEWFSLCIVRGGGVVNEKVYFGRRGWIFQIFFDKCRLLGDNTRESQRSILWMNTTDTNATSATTFTTPKAGIRKPAKMLCRGLPSMNCPITGFVPIAERKKKISRISAESTTFG